MGSEMLRRITAFFQTHKVVRYMSCEGDDKGPRDPSSKDALDDDLLSAVESVANELHGNNANAKKITKNTLISKLISHEKATFEEATQAQTEELLSDTGIINLLHGVDLSPKSIATVSDYQSRYERRGMVLLRKEIFYQAIQKGYKADDARIIAEKAVDQARERLADKRKSPFNEERKDTKDEIVKNKTERHFFNYAYQMAEKMLYKDDHLSFKKSRGETVKANSSEPSLMNSQKRLGLWNSLERCENSSLGFWTEWNRRAARFINQSMGPTNSFEEQIEWTKDGKQWVYPIDNEAMLGEEENVPFFEHIFLERHLPSLGLPKDGPIAHFMELVCIGLSKNPYMTVAKKLDHLRWFGNYFNEEKQKLINKLNEQEQIHTDNH